MHLGALAVLAEKFLAQFLVLLAQLGHSGLLLFLQFGEERLDFGLSLVVGHLGLRAIEDSGHAVGKVGHIYFVNARSTEIVAHAESESVAQTVEPLVFVVFHF